MKKCVYTCYSVPMAWHVRNVLQQHDIATTLKNDNLYSVSGEVPFTECMPEVWVNNPLDFTRAKRLIAEMESDADSDTDAVDWSCEKCGESNAPTFEICWKCQSAAPQEN